MEGCSVIVRRICLHAAGRRVPVRPTMTARYLGDILKTSCYGILLLFNTLIAYELRLENIIAVSKHRLDKGNVKTEGKFLTNTHNTQQPGRME